MNRGLDSNGLFRTPIRFQDVRRDPETGRLVPNSEAVPRFSYRFNFYVLGALLVSGAAWYFIFWGITFVFGKVAR